MKAQVRIEFIISIVIFAVIIFFLATQINTLSATVAQNSIRDSLKGEAIAALTVFAEDSGEPDNWESLPTENVLRVGLADSPYRLSNNKISRLNSECSLLEKYDLDSYRLVIKNSTSQILFCGSRSLEPPVVSITRTVFIDNNYGNITLEMY